MCKGRPFTRREKRDVWEMRNEKFPSLIARHLMFTYPLDNGGQRTDRGVRQLITRLKQADAEGRLREELGTDDLPEIQEIPAPPPVPVEVKKRTGKRKTPA